MRLVPVANRCDSACVTTVPLYFCAAIYVTLARTIEELNANLSRVRPELLYWFFIPADFISLVIQAVGGALSTSSKGTSVAGVNIALAGLSMQVVTICVFCGLMGDFILRYMRSIEVGAKFSPRLRIFFAFLGVAIGFITVRCIYRLVELNQGYSGKLVRDQPLYIVFEGM